MLSFYMKLPLSNRGEVSTELSCNVMEKKLIMNVLDHKKVLPFISLLRDLPILHCALQQGNVLQLVLCYRRGRALEQSSCFQFLLAKE